IDGEACRRFHVQARERGGVLALAGDVEESEVAAEIADLLRLPPPGRPGEAADEAVGATEPRRAVATAARDQSHLFVGHRTVPADHPDLPALDLASIVLGAGSGLTGRIPTRVREREGLAYSATAGLTAGAGLDAGRLVVHVATSPAQVARAEACVREEIGRLCDEGVSETEVEEARSYVLRREPFRRETARQWAGLLARSSLYGMPVDDAAWVEARYRALDRAAVEAAIRRHLEPARLQVTVGSPASGAARAVC
ncbi:MAG: insulinase family protein, partial [Thermoanaerobaculia bacterium]|nr:insulinase family protein [Thermoanaerobaculia bacterium]